MTGKRKRTAQMAVRRPHGRPSRIKSPRNRRTARRRSRYTVWRAAFWCLVACVAILALLILPLRWLHPPVTAFMLQQSAAGQRAYEWVPLSDISRAAQLAVIAAEDQRFGTHNGLDLDAIQKAIGDAGNGASVRGASTITQQLVKNLYLWPGRSLVRKGLEAGLSLLVDAWLPKQRILELYLNVVEFGPGIYGVGAASRIYFHKSPRQLTSYEAALLAAVLPNPAAMKVSAPSAYVRGRQQWIVEQMQHLRLDPIMQN